MRVVALLLSNAVDCAVAIRAIIPASAQETLRDIQIGQLVRLRFEQESWGRRDGIVIMREEIAAIDAAIAKEGKRHD